MPHDCRSHGEETFGGHDELSRDSLDFMVRPIFNSLFDALHAVIKNENVPAF